MILGGCQKARDLFAGESPWQELVARQRHLPARKWADHRLRVGQVSKKHAQAGHPTPHRRRSEFALRDHRSKIGLELTVAYVTRACLRTLKLMEVGQV